MSRVYSAPPGVVIRGGRFAPSPSLFAPGSEVGTLSAGLWTPARAADGRVTKASVDALPLDTWVKVAGSSLTTLQGIIETIGGRPYADYDLSDAKSIASTFRAWVGCAVAHGHRVIYSRGGGHADSAVNGVWEFDAVRMGWNVLGMPSLPDERWNLTYGKNTSAGNGSGSWTLYKSVNGPSGVTVDSDGLSWDRLPDDRPTSAHTYGGVWWDSLRNRIGTARVSKWEFDLNTNEWLPRTRWLDASGTPQILRINQLLHYHAGKDALYGDPGGSTLDSDTWSFAKIPMTTNRVDLTITKPSPWATTGASASCRLDEDRLLFLWTTPSGLEERYGIYNMATETTESTGLVGNPRPQTHIEAEMLVCQYVPTWGAAGQVIRRGTAGVDDNFSWLFDIATKSNVPYEPQGSYPATCHRPGNKYTTLPALKLLLLVDDDAPISQPAIHVMRYA
jgi:hypothetical protein